MSWLEGFAIHDILTYLLAGLSSIIPRYLHTLDMLVILLHERLLLIILTELMRQDGNHLVAVARS